MFKRALLIQCLVLSPLAVAGDPQPQDSVLIKPGDPQCRSNLALDKTQLNVTFRTIEVAKVASTAADISCTTYELPAHVRGNISTDEDVKLMGPEFQALFE